MNITHDQPVTASAMPPVGTVPGIGDAGGQGRPSSSAMRRTVSLYAMAVEGLRFDACATIDAPHGLGEALRIVIARGIDVYQAVDRAGPAGVRSVKDAAALRVLLGYASGRFEGIEHDTLARDGLSMLHIAQIRMGIRHRNGDVRRGWC